MMANPMRVQRLMTAAQGEPAALVEKAGNSIDFCPFVQITIHFDAGAGRARATADINCAVIAL